MDEANEPNQPSTDEPGSQDRAAHEHKPGSQDRAAHEHKETEPEPMSHDDPRLGDVLPKVVRQRIESFIPDLVRRTFAAGMGAVFTTEEGIRRMTKDLSLPKDVAGYLASTAGNTKDEIVRIIAREVREFLQTVNLSEEIAKMLTTLSFEVKTEIRFIPNEEKFGTVKPDVKARVRLKNSGTEDDRSRRRRRRRRRRREEDDGSRHDASD